MVTSEVKRTTISILRRTKEDLDSIKHTGQSYNGLIQDLIRLWEKEHPPEETGRVASAEERGRGG